MGFKFSHYLTWEDLFLVFARQDFGLKKSKLRKVTWRSRQSKSHKEQEQLKKKRTSITEATRRLTKRTTAPVIRERAIAVLSDSTKDT